MKMRTGWMKALCLVLGGAALGSDVVMAAPEVVSCDQMSGTVSVPFSYSPRGDGHYPRTFYLDLNFGKDPASLTVTPKLSKKLPVTYQLLTQKMVIFADGSARDCQEKLNPVVDFFVDNCFETTNDAMAALEFVDEHVEEGRNRTPAQKAALSCAKEIVTKFRAKALEMEKQQAHASVTGDHPSFADVKEKKENPVHPSQMGGTPTDQMSADSQTPGHSTQAN